MRSAFQSVFLALLVIGLPGTVGACSVPVFRYALEHWAPDDYQALVFHRGPLEGSAADALGRLGEAVKGRRLNLSLRTVDLAGDEAEAWRPVWEQLDGKALPWMLVRPDPRSGRDWFRLSLPLDVGTVSRLLDSPARGEIVRRIESGDSVVWVLLESGNREADVEAARRLEERLNYLGSVLKLPELSEADIANGLVSVGAEGLNLKFSSLRISREAPAESLFVRFLLGVEHDLEELDEPMVFPLYGQGRSMPPLVGKGIGHAMIDEDAIFLVGSCSCEVKEQNPGVDLLMQADWVGLVKRQASTSPIRSAQSATMSAAPELVTFADPVEMGARDPVDAPEDDSDYLVPLILFLIAAAALSWKGR